MSAIRLSLGVCPQLNVLFDTLTPVQHLQACARLHSASMLDDGERAALKELIIDEDMRVQAALEVYEMDRDVDEFLDTMQRIGRRAAEQMDC